MANTLLDSIVEQLVVPFCEPDVIDVQGSVSYRTIWRVSRRLICVSEDIWQKRFNGVGYKSPSVELQDV